MHNFKVVFSSSPFWLLLLIPALAAILIPYFLISKKYRRNRNRIVAMVLEFIVMVMAIFTLAGISFTYEIYNPENEILLVVDASYSTKEEKDLKDNYVNDVISVTNTQAYKLGIIVFGFDQQYAVPLTNDLTNAYDQYLAATLEESTTLDTSATDISSALTYADSLLDYPESAKIVLVSDGLETDEAASSVIRGIAARGVRVDTVCTQTLKADGEVQVVDSVLPDYNVAVDEVFDITLTIQNNYPTATEVSVTIIDNDESGEPTTVSISANSRDVVLEHSFTSTGLHRLNFIVSADSDSLSQNNSYYTYTIVNEHDKILIVESFESEASALKSFLENQTSSDTKYQVTIANVHDSDFPTTLDELRQYDEIILNNIANKDFADEGSSENFFTILYDYVYTVGGGLFTVGGGENGDPETAHAYDRADMLGSLYQEMLPVEAINYTPPLGLVIVIDVSGSMSSYLETAKLAALNIVKDETCLTERDYCGVITLSEDADEIIQMSPMTKQDEIISAINSIELGGMTNFNPSIVRAGRDLRNLYSTNKIQKMHTIVITDGAAADYEKYMESIAYYNNLGVTYSFIAINASNQEMVKLKAAAKAGGGYAINSSARDLTIMLKNDIRVPEIKDVEPGEFVPTLNSSSSYASIIKQEEMPKLYGFYGTKARTNAEVVMTNTYGAPIYAQWKFGAGMVGSFMCDLNGNWSSDFMSDSSGQNLLLSIINKLFPSGNIRAQNIQVSLREENYITQLSIYPSSDLKKGETMQVQAENLSLNTSTVTLIQPSQGDNYSRATLIAKDAGIYRVTVQRLDASGTVIDSYTFYKAFSYSDEYNMFNDTDRIAFMQSLAASGNGTAVQLADAEAYKIFEGFITGIEKSFDPRYLMMIIAIVLFLLDIAVRKFKFKWIHELIREHKEKKQEEEQN